MGNLRDMVRTTHYESWKDLNDCFDELSYADKKSNLWIYRGHACVDWWLKPSIERFHESLEAPRAPYSILDLEKQLLYDFRSLASQFLTNLPADDDTLEWLAILQHHGTPTRLLDWTYSPTVGAYFALRDKRTGDSEGGNSCVWALNLSKLNKCVRKRVKARDWPSAYQEALKQAQKNSAPSLVTPFLPRNRYSRMSGQQGLFLLKTKAEEPFMANLHRMCSLADQNFIRRLIIPRSERARILAHLLEHNTHEVGLFPDADGLGRFVRTKVEVQSQTLGLSEPRLRRATMPGELG